MLMENALLGAGLARENVSGGPTHHHLKCLESPKEAAGSPGLACYMRGIFIVFRKTFPAIYNTLEAIQCCPDFAQF